MERIAGLVGLGDAGERAPEAASCQPAQQFGVQRPPTAQAQAVARHIDAGLHRPVIGGPRIELVRIGITSDSSVDLEHQPFVPHSGGGNTGRHLVGRRGFGLEGDHGIQHIRAIDLGARGGISIDRGTDP
jgi:hypothetical protein